MSEETQNESCEVSAECGGVEATVGEAGRKSVTGKSPDTEMGLPVTGKLGRWYDSKRAGRPNWIVIWDGWDMVEGYRLAKSLDQETALGQGEYQKSASKNIT